MQSQELVILHCNLTIAQSLLSALRSSFPSIHHVASVEELRASIAKHRPSIAIVDMENASLLDLRQLAAEFPGACLVCTHRCADEEMWAAALNAGATDLLSSFDTRGIVQAALRTDTAARIAAA
jgi:DNA-binding NarL/FixJ family response regulator